MEKASRSFVKLNIISEVAQVDAVACPKYGITTKTDRSAILCTVSFLRFEYCIALVDSYTVQEQPRDIHQAVKVSGKPLGFRNLFVAE